MTMKKTDSPLSRWSQRKMLVQEGKIPSDAPAEPLSGPDAEQQSAQTDELCEQGNEKGEEQQAVPPREDEIDTEKFANVDYEALDYDSDYTQFMAKNVPEFVRRKALRALWNSDPVFANLDGLNDYDEDFTIVEPMTKAIESAWNMGKGYMTAEEEEKKKAAREEEEEEEVQVVSAEEADDETLDDELIAPAEDGISKDESMEVEAQSEDLDEKTKTS